MGKSRLEAFSDGVFAILITILVLELKVPHGEDWHALRPLVPTFLAYAMSFVFIAIYWNNHHHMLHASERISGNVLWANTHLLFWLSLIPFTTAWMGEHHLAPLPTAIYGAVLLVAGASYSILQASLIRVHGPGSKLGEATSGNVKEKASILLYGAAIPLAFVRTWIAHLLYLTVALIWLVPDRRIEKRLRHDG